MLRAERVDRSIFALAFVAAAIYLALSGLRPFFGDVALKSSLCALLAIAALRHRKWLLTPALILASIGDALLAIDEHHLFISALVAFLLTHVLYSTAFVHAARLQMDRLDWWRRLFLAITPIVTALYLYVLWPHLGALRGPVIAYATIISLMLMLSLRVPVVIIPLGAMLFYLSDGMIAAQKFLHPVEWIGPLIWITYACAQLLIAWGLMHMQLPRDASSSHVP